MKNIIVYAMIVGIFFLDTSCNSDNDKIGTAKLNIRLTDAPGDFSAVYIDIKGIEINTGDSDNENGWQTLTNTKAGVYDLLKLTNGTDTLIASQELPTGKISQIRLILGENNSLRIGAKVYPLKTPSALQSGLKLQVKTNLTAGITYTMLLDFDAAQSIVLTNTGNYNLKPVIRTVVEAQNGAIKGLIASPLSSSHAILAISGNDTVATFSDENGNFLIRGLRPANYKIVILPGEKYQPASIDNITVQTGKVTLLDRIEIHNQTF